MPCRLTGKKMRLPSFDQVGGMVSGSPTSLIVQAEAWRSYGAGQVAGRRRSRPRGTIHTFMLLVALVLAFVAVISNPSAHPVRS